MVVGMVVMVVVVRMMVGMVGEMEVPVMRQVVAAVFAALAPTHPLESPYVSILEPS